VVPLSTTRVVPLRWLPSSETRNNAAVATASGPVAQPPDVRRLHKPQGGDATSRIFGVDVTVDIPRRSRRSVQAVGDQVDDRLAGSQETTSLVILSKRLVVSYFRLFPVLVRVMGPPPDLYLVLGRPRKNVAKDETDCQSRIWHVVGYSGPMARTRDEVARRRRWTVLPTSCAIRARNPNRHHTGDP
jgi:hypothetical protein